MVNAIEKLRMKGRRLSLKLSSKKIIDKRDFIGVTDVEKNWNSIKIEETHFRQEIALDHPIT